MKRETQEVPTVLLSQVVLDREAGILQDSDCKAASNITARVDWNSHRHLPSLVSKRQVTARLSVFYKPVGFEEADKIVCRDLRHPAH